MDGDEASSPDKVSESPPVSEEEDLATEEDGVVGQDGATDSEEGEAADQDAVTDGEEDEQGHQVHGTPARTQVVHDAKTRMWTLYNCMPGNTCPCLRIQRNCKNIIFSIVGLFRERNGVWERPESKVAVLNRMEIYNVFNHREVPSPAPVFMLSPACW